MSMRTCRRLATGLVVLLVTASCTDLTVEPKSTVTSGNIFNEPGAYRSFLAKIYGGLAVTGQEGPAGRPDIAGIDEGFSQYLRLVWQMQTLPTDEAGIAWDDDGVQELNTQLWSSSNQFLVAMYYRIFFQVALANEFLRESTDGKLSERGVSDQLRAQIQTYRAEARFLRALSYWHGLDLFGSIPLVDENFPRGATPPQQASSTELFQFIESELLAVRNDLPPTGASSSYGRGTPAAASMLLAKLYMNAEVYTGSARYADARAAVEQVIAGPFNLKSNYLHNFLADNHTSDEIIFAIPFDGVNTRTWGGMTFLIHAAVGGSMDAGAFGIGGGWRGLRAKQEFVALFPGGSGSADRRASSVMHTDGQDSVMHSRTEWFHGFGVPKYRNVTSTGAPGKDAQFPDTDFPVWRLADAYLMYAEAHLRGGGGTEAAALAYVNALRQRAYGDASGNITAPQLTLDFILAERARELYWEGHRRTDLLRYGRFTSSGVWAWKGDVPAGQVTDSYRNLYPLPASELLANPNLTQNPGYGG